MEPRNERILTLDKNPELLFKAWQQAGKIPPEYTSWGELESTYMNLVNSGLSEKEAREAMGVTYRNVDGQNLLQINQASDGSTRGLNKRAIRVDLNVGAESHLKRRGGQAAVEERANQIRTDWNKLAKLEAQQLGVETGKQFHRGHVVAGLEGGSLAIENMWPEQGTRNVLHGKEPRLPVPVIQELGIPMDDLANIYERQLQSEGLSASPRISNALMIAADEYMVQPQSGTSYSKPGDMIHDPTVGIDPNRLAALQDRLNQLEAQGIPKQAIENWARNQSGTLSNETSVSQSGPVRQVVPPRKVPVTVKSPGSVRPATRLIPSGSSPALATRSANLGARAAAIATRQPPPKPTVKPPAKPTRKAPAAPSATKPTNRTQTPLEQIRRLQRTVPDVIQIHPGMGLPSQSLIQGI